MKYIASWSGGKDSTASIILAHENKEPLDIIIFSEVMFDKNISGELPEHIDFIKNKCIPLFESWGYKTKILHADLTYMDIFLRQPTRGKRFGTGMITGFPMSRRCQINRSVKVLPIKRFLKSFEEEFSAFTGAKYCLGLASGLDSLWIALRALKIGEGDEVIVQGNTYIASVMGITINGATPVFVEPDPYYNIDASSIEDKITDKTKAILVVHLYGQASNMQPIMELSKKYHLRVVEDCAQSHGAYFNGKMTGTFGDIGCFSFYPSKNLGAFGDGGAIITNDEKIAEDIRVFRNYGSERRYYNKVVGTNSRLDEIQAGFLRIKLRHLKEL